jgi:uroporphyrinogen-III synthase
LDSYDWILFTSANAVSAVARLISNGSRRPRGRIACVGTATKHAIEALGWHVELVPDQFVAEALAEALTEAGIRGARILIPSAAVTRDVLSKTLTEHGADVHIVEAYRNVMPDAAAESALELFSSAIKPDWVTFTSSSSVDNLIAVTGPARLKEVKIACIGPITAASVRAHGLSVDVQPQEHSVTKMLQAIFEVK